MRASRYYALGVDSIPYKDGINGVPEWTEKLQKLAWDTAKMPAQVYLVSKKSKTLFGDGDNVFTALLLSGPDYHSSKEGREAVAKALGFGPEDIVMVYPAFLPE
ncbi:hypothetical protein BDN70DRAFT_920661 [Pholiota conissans]|uniref:Uncharacterized protein n=1 Tax=Pholiota conissans TaxID=109636 RepID=A0A9P5Z4Y0_9AGAR|nr:hypothetical protein BDN70DRAFT_920661 [Pholiota conissans]